MTMAPEILKNEEENKEYSDKCDLWSIGVIIYVLFFKRPPYIGENAISILNKIKNLGQRILKKTVYDKLDDLISKLLIEDPIKRISCKEYYNHPFFKDEIILRYKTDEKKEKKILGKEFVEQNGNICYIMHKNKEYELSKCFKVEENNDDKIIKIIGLNRVNNIIYMFYKCSSLVSIGDISNMNTRNINDMSYMFYECSSLKNITDISKWEISEVTNMSYMFAKCHYYLLYLIFHNRICQK